MASYYPQINYLGAAQGMVGIIENAERQRLAEQESIRRQEEAQSLARYRDMQIQKMQEEEARKTKLNDVMTRYAQEAEGPDFKTSLAQRAVMDPNPPLGGAFEAYPQARTENFVVPPRKRFGEGLSGMLAKEGMGAEALTQIAKERDEKAKESKDALDFWQKGAMKFIENGDNEGLKTWIDQGKKNPLIAGMVGPLEGITVNPKTKEMKIEVEMDLKDGQMKNPINGEPLPAGRYLIEQTVDTTGRQTITKAKPVEAKTKDKFEQAGYGRLWDKEEKKFVPAPVNPSDSGFSNYVKQMELERRDREEERRTREEAQKKTEAGAKADLTTSKMLNDSSNRMGGRPDNELKPEALRAINATRTAAGLPPLKKVVETGRTEPGKYWGTNPLPDRITYVPDEKAAPVAPPRPAPGTGLSGMLPVKPPVAPVAPPVRTAAPMTVPPIQPGGGLAGRAAKTPAPPKQGEIITKEKAMEYRRKAKSQQEAEEMARKDGWTF